jgi:hypothetical protein
MTLIIEARLESADPYPQCEPIRLASIERPNEDRNLRPSSMTHPTPLSNPLVDLVAALRLP